jgi:hypothetical protein
MAKYPGGYRRGTAMSQLQFYNLGERGMEYIRERLEGGKTLAHLLLESIDLQQGRAWSYLPPNMPASEVMKFDEGVRMKYEIMAGIQREARGNGLDTLDVLTPLSCVFFSPFQQGLPSGRMH